LPVIEDLTAFFKHDQFHLLIGLEKNIKQKSSELNKANEIKQFSDAILSNELFTKESEQTKTIKQLEAEIVKREESLNIKLKETELKINQIEEGIEELSIIISNIKSSGQSYLKLNPKAEDCPLCNTNFSNNDLADAIQRTQESFSNSIVLTSLKEELEYTKKRLEEIDKQLEAVNKIKTLAFSIFAASGLEKPINEIRKSSIENTKTLTKLTETLIQLNTVLSQLNNSNLTEDKFLTLLNRVEDFLLVKIQSNTELDIQKQTLIEKQNELTSAILQLDKVISEKQSLLNTSFTVEIENEEKLLKRLNMLQEVESNFKQLEIYLNIPVNTTLINILEKVRSVKSVFETYKKAAIELKQQNQVVELTKKEIDKILTEIEIIKPKQSRAQFANNELNNLLTEQSKNDFLSDYISKNKKEIVSIFKLIHTPSEFIDINFTANKITLITNDENERTLSEISTGQRSALALSIFLSLNKKLSKGPNILMFDDPVTYVDDMNVLSFFDYLRELVIKSKRQVFFATANDDLAFLFKKKFEFLGSELTDIKLERKNENV
jgi:DNA repair exonuclease SbcCD ATPase subunit